MTAVLDVPDGTEITVSGRVWQLTQRYTGLYQLWASAILIVDDSPIEVLVFPREWERLGPLFAMGATIELTVRADRRYGFNLIVVEEPRLTPRHRPARPDRGAAGRVRDVPVTRAKTVGQWRREVPDFDRAYRAVLHLSENWPGWTVPHMVAHIHPDTLAVSIVLHGDYAQQKTVDEALTDRHGFPAGGWTRQTVCGVPVRRKTVTG